MKCLIYIASLCLLACTSKNDAAQVPTEQATLYKELAALHRLYLDEGDDELFEKAAQLVQALRSDDPVASNVFNLLRASTERRCRLPIVELQEKLATGKGGSLIFGVYQSRFKDESTYQVKVHISLTPEKTMLWPAITLQQEGGDALHIPLHHGTNEENGRETYQSEPSPTPIKAGLYRLTARSDQGEQTLMRFFWLDQLSIPQRLNLTQPARDQIFATSFPTFRWQIREAWRGANCSKVFHDLQIKNMQTNMTWNQKLIPASATMSVFARSLGWENAEPLSGGDYQLILKTTQSMQEKQVQMQSQISWKEPTKVVVRGYNSCRRNFGMSWDEGENDLSGFSYYYAWIGWDKTFLDAYYRMMLTDNGPGHRAEGLTPAYMAEVLSQVAMLNAQAAFSAKSWTEADSAAFRQKFLNVDGVSFFRRDRREVLEVYARYAKGTASIIGAEGEIIWFIEPFLFELFQKTQRPKPLSMEEAATFLADIYFIVKKELPFARMIFPAAKATDVQQLWAATLQKVGVTIDGWQYAVQEGKNDWPSFAALSEQGRTDNFFHLLISKEAEQLNWLSQPQLQALQTKSIGSLSLHNSSSVVRRRVAVLNSENNNFDPVCVNKQFGKKVTMSAGLYDTDFLYGDYLRLQKSDPQQCEKACAEEVLCRAWTWSRENYCYLKNVTLRQKAAPGLVSGYKIEPRVHP